MKKLVIAVAMVCAAAISQAASVVWGANASKDYNSQKMYLLTSMSKSYDSVAAFESSAIDAATVKKVGMKYTIAGHTVEGVTASDNFYLAALAVDATGVGVAHYINVTDSVRATLFEPPATAGSAHMANFATVATSSTTSAIGAVPEPTSGLLLLLGMAGLALKRKQA